ncbi:MAG: DNA polymerase III subunit chi [Magnetococcales bacterium]|nr:DNA polymerase III subunit chi [Magnetococcales bacterium]
MSQTDPSQPTTVRFYQLGLSTLEMAVTAILSKAWDRGIKSLLLTPGEDAVRYWDAQLWRAPQEGFLPHGPASGNDPERQPILISSELTDQNGASLIILTAPRLVTTPEQFDMVVDFVDGQNPEARLASRSRYAHYRDLGCRLEYWAQEPDRRWSLKNKTPPTKPA